MQGVGSLHKFSKYWKPEFLINWKDSPSTKKFRNCLIFDQIYYLIIVFCFFTFRHVECFICEQNLAGVGIGMACRDRTVVFMSTFACFFSRAFDNFRMGIISQTNINVAGSHCGVSIGNYFFSNFNFLKTFFSIFEN